MNARAQNLEINNMTVDNSQSKEATVLKLAVIYNSDMSNIGLNSNNNLEVVRIQNSTFTNIMT